MSLQVEPIYFKKHLRWLTALGIDVKPVKNVWYEWIYRLYAWTILGYVYVYCLLELIDTITASDINSMTFGLSYFVTHFLGAAKITILIIKKGTLQEMLKKLERGYFGPNIKRGGENEIRFIKAAIRRTNLHVDIFNTFVYFIIGVRCLYAIFDKGQDIELVDEHLNTTVYKHIRTLPYKAWFPVDLNESPAFEIMFFVQATCLILYGFYINLLDSLVYGMMIHIDTQFNILRHLLNEYVPIAKAIVSTKTILEDIIPSGDMKRNSQLTDSEQEMIKNIVHYCARYHLEIINYCNRIESEFSYLMLMQFLSSLYILCFQLFQLSLMQNMLSFDFISMCLYLVLMMYQLFCYCWYGNEVMMHSSSFSIDLYNTDWLRINNTIRKSLLLMMMRAQRPIRFTAGKFALLSLPTYMTIVRGSASYFMVLRQMER